MSSFGPGPGPSSGGGQWWRYYDGDENGITIQVNATRYISANANNGFPATGSASLYNQKVMEPCRITAIYFDMAPGITAGIDIVLQRNGTDQPSTAVSLPAGLARASGNMAVDIALDTGDILVWKVVTSGTVVDCTVYHLGVKLLMPG